MTNQVISVNFVQPEFGKPTKYVPSWGLKYDFEEVVKNCEGMEPGEWLPVTLADPAKAMGFQGSALKRGLFNVVRRKNVVYVQLLDSNERIDPKLRVTQATEGKYKRKKAKKE